MQRRPYSDRNVSPVLLCNNHKCDNISSKLYIVEEKIIEALKIWLSEYKIDYGKVSSESWKANILMHKENIVALERELDKEKKRLTKVYIFLEDGTYTKEMFTDRSKSISDRINKINNNIQKHQKEMENKSIISESKRNSIFKMENVLELYDRLQEDEDKSNLLKAVLEKVTYNKTTKAIKKDSNPTDFEITIYPKLPSSY